MQNDSQNSRFAHDLRNSLSVIYSYTQMLEHMLDTKATQKELDIAKSIRASAKKMNALICSHEEGLLSPSEAAATNARTAETEGLSC